MNILHIINAYTNIDGIYTFLQRFASAVSEKNIHNYFLAWEPSSGYFESKQAQEDLSNVRLVTQNGANGILSELNPSLIVHHDSRYMEVDSILGQRASLCLERIPRLRMIHDIKFFCPRRFFVDGVCCQRTLGEACVKCGCIDQELYERYAEHLERNRKLDGFLCLSPYIEQKLKAHGFSPSGIHRIPAMIPLRLKDSITRENNMLYVGRISTEKGIEQLLQSLSHLKAEDWKLYIAGTGTRKAVHDMLLAIRQNKKIAPHVEYLGYLQGDALHQRFQNARVVVLPSIIGETYGYSGAEALSYGIPVVSYDVNRDSGWMVENQTGRSVPLEDEHAFANALDALFACEKQYEELCEGARTHAKKLFHSKQNEQVEALVQHLANAAGKDGVCLDTRCIHA